MDKMGFMCDTWKCVTLLHSLQPDAPPPPRAAEALLLGDLTFSCTDVNIAQMREELGLSLLNESGFSSLY